MISPIKVTVEKAVKILISLLSVALLCSCSEKQQGDEKVSLAALPEIRNQARNLPEYANLRLKDTVIYIPEVDTISGFSFVPVVPSSEEREEDLLSAAELFSGKKADVNNIEYLTKTNETLSYSEIGADEKDGCFFVKYKGNGCDLGINIGGNYLYARKTDIPKIAGADTDDYWIEFGVKKESYNLRTEIPDIKVELVDGEESASSIAENMLNILQNEMPYFASEELVLKPNTAEIYKLGEKNGINIGFLYEYGGVPIDSYFRGSYVNLNNDNRCTRTAVSCEASSIRSGSIDELYSARNFAIKETGEIYDSFIDLNSALSIVSEKLTGASVFNIESIELSYGLDRILPDQFYESEAAKAFEYEPIRIEAKPVWIVNIPDSGMAEAPYLRVIVDAITGEIELLK